MRSTIIPFVILLFIMSISKCKSYTQDYHPNQMAHDTNSILSSATDTDNPDSDLIDKRAERYAFGLGRRGYTYTSGGPGQKRLPVYNFGLGKRARQYSFGLGKRNQIDSSKLYDKSDFDEYSLPEWQEYQVWLKQQHLQNAEDYASRLGKRMDFLVSEDGVERRSPQRYNFGLGKR